MKILRRFYTGLLIAACLSGPAMSLPEGANVTHGTVNINTNGSTQTITQSSNKAIINWNGFNIDVGELVHFVQPSSISAILNRVVGQDPSQILGSLRANGQVFLINPNGVVFGQTANIDVGSLVVSTLNITDDDFLAGNLSFEQEADAELAAVINHGKITIDENGFLVLTGPMVVNEGLILAKVGQVALAAGTKSTVSFDPTGMIQVALPEGSEVNEGIVSLTKSATTDLLSGVVGTGGAQAGQLVVRDGKTVLEVASGTLVNTGEIRADANSGETAGRVVLDSTSNTLLAETSLISAAGSGADSNGGEVFVLSDGQSTSFEGSFIDVSAGNTGDGGFAEQSGGFGSVSVLVDARAPGGETGTFLIDPDRILVEDGAGTGPGDMTLMRVSENSIETALADVVLQADDGVTIEDLTDNLLTIPVGLNLTVDVIDVGDGSPAFDMNASDQIVLTGTSNFLLQNTTGEDINNLRVTTDSGNITISNSLDASVTGDASFASTTGTTALFGVDQFGTALNPIEIGGRFDPTANDVFIDGTSAVTLVTANVANLTATGSDYTISGVNRSNDLNGTFDFNLTGDIGGTELEVANLTIVADDITFIELDVSNANLTANSIDADFRDTEVRPLADVVVTNTSATGDTFLTLQGEGDFLFHDKMPDPAPSTLRVEGVGAGNNLTYTTSGNPALDIFNIDTFTLVTDGGISGTLELVNTANLTGAGIIVSPTGLGGTDFNLTATAPLFIILTETGTFNGLGDVTASAPLADVTISTDGPLNVLSGTGINIDLTGATVTANNLAASTSIDATSTSGDIQLNNTLATPVTITADAFGGSANATISAEGDIIIGAAGVTGFDVDITGTNDSITATGGARITGLNSVVLGSDGEVNVNSTTDDLAISAGGNVTVDNQMVAGNLLTDITSGGDVSLTSDGAIDAMGPMQGITAAANVIIQGTEIDATLTGAQSVDFTATDGDVNIAADGPITATGSAVVVTSLDDDAQIIVSAPGDITVGAGGITATGMGATRVDLDTGAPGNGDILGNGGNITGETVVLQGDNVDANSIEADSVNAVASAGNVMITNTPLTPVTFTGSATGDFTATSNGALTAGVITANNIDLTGPSIAAPSLNAANSIDLISTAGNISAFNTAAAPIIFTADAASGTGDVMLDANGDISIGAGNVEGANVDISGSNTSITASGLGRIVGNNSLVLSSSGDINVNTDTNDLRVTTAGNITVDNQGITAGNLILQASGDTVVVAADTDIEAVVGRSALTGTTSVDLSAPNITANVSSPLVDVTAFAGDAIITLDEATTTITGLAVGTANLTNTGDLVLGAISASDLVLSGATITAPNVMATSSINATSTSGSIDITNAPLPVTPVTFTADGASGSGDVTFNSNGDITVGAAGVNGLIVTLDSMLSIDTASGLVQGDTVNLVALANITTGSGGVQGTSAVDFTGIDIDVGTGAVTGGTIDVTATGDVNIGSGNLDGTDVTIDGPANSVTATSGRIIGSSSVTIDSAGQVDVFTTTGDLDITAVGNVTVDNMVGGAPDLLARINTTGAIDLMSDGDIDALGGGLGFTGSSVTLNAPLIDADIFNATSVGFTATAGDAFIDVNTGSPITVTGSATDVASPAAIIIGNRDVVVGAAGITATGGTDPTVVIDVIDFMNDNSISGTGLITANTVFLSADTIQANLDSVTVVDAVSTGDITLVNQNVTNVSVLAVSDDVGDVSYTGGDNISIRKLFTRNGDISVVSPGSTIDATTDPSSINIGEGFTPPGNTIATQMGAITLEGASITANVTADSVDADSTGNIILMGDDNPLIDINANSTGVGTTVSMNETSVGGTVTGFFNADNASVTAENINVTLGTSVDDVSLTSLGGDVTAAGNSAALALTASGPSSFILDVTNVGGDLTTTGGITADTINLTASGMITSGGTLFAETEINLQAGTGITAGIGGSEIVEVDAVSTAGNVMLTGDVAVDVGIQGSAGGLFQLVNEDAILLSGDITANSIYLEATDSRAPIIGFVGALNAPTVTLLAGDFIDVTTENVNTLNATATGGDIDIVNSMSNITAGNLMATGIGRGGQGEGEGEGPPFGFGSNIDLSNTGDITGTTLTASGQITVTSTGGGDVDIVARLPGGLNVSGGTVTVDTSGPAILTQSTAGNIEITTSFVEPTDFFVAADSADDLRVTNNDGSILFAMTQAVGDIVIAAPTGDVTTLMPPDPVIGATIDITADSVTDFEVQTSAVTLNVNTTANIIGSSVGAMNVSGTGGDITVSNTNGLTVGAVTATTSVDLDGGLGDVLQTSGRIDSPTVDIIGNNIDVDLEGTGDVDVVGQGAVTVENQNIAAVTAIVASLGVGDVSYTGGDAINIDRLYAADGDVSLVSPGSSIVAVTESSIVDVGGFMPPGLTIAAPNGTITLEGTSITAFVTTTDVTATGTEDINLIANGNPSINVTANSSGGNVDFDGNGLVTGSFNGNAVDIASATINVSTGTDVTGVITDASTGDVTVVGNSADLAVTNNSMALGTASFTNNGGNMTTTAGFSANDITMVATGSLITTGVLDAGSGQVTLGGSSIDSDITAGTLVANATTGNVDVLGIASPSITVGGSAGGEFRVVNVGSLVTDQITANSIFLDAQAVGSNLSNNSGTLNAATVTVNADGTVDATTENVTTLNSNGGLGVAITNSGSDITSGLIVAQDTLGMPAVDANVTLRNTGAISGGLAINATGDIIVESTGGGVIDILASDLDPTNASNLNVSGGSVTAFTTEVASVDATSTAGNIDLTGNFTATTDLAVSADSAGDLDIENFNGGLVLSATQAVGDVNLTALGQSISNSPGDPLIGNSVTVEAGDADLEVQTGAVDVTLTTTGNIMGTTVTPMAVEGTGTTLNFSNTAGGLTVGPIGATTVTLDGGTGDVTQSSGRVDARTVTVDGNDIVLDLTDTNDLDAVGQGAVTIENQAAVNTNIVVASLGTGDVSYTGGDNINVQRLYAANGNVSLVSPGSAISATADPTMVDVGGTMPAGNTIAAPNGTITLEGASITANITTDTVTADATGNIALDSTGSPDIMADLDSSGGTVSLNADSAVTGSFNGTTADITGTTINVSTGTNVTGVTTDASTGDVTVVGNSANLAVTNNSMALGTASFTNNGGGMTTTAGFAANDITLIATGDLVTTGLIDAGSGNMVLTGNNVTSNIVAGNLTATATGATGSVDIMGASPSLTLDGSAGDEFRVINSGAIATGPITAGSIFLEAQGSGNDLTNSSGTLNAATVTVNADGNVVAITENVTTLNSTGGTGVDITNSGSNITGGTITAQDTLGMPAADADVMISNDGSITGLGVNATGNMTVTSTGGGAIDITATDLDTSTGSSLTTSGGSVNANLTGLTSVDATSSAGNIDISATSGTPVDLSVTANSAGDLDVENLNGGLTFSSTQAVGDIVIDALLGSVLTSPGDPLIGNSVTVTSDDALIEVETGSVNLTVNTTGTVTGGTVTPMAVQGSGTTLSFTNATGGLNVGPITASSVTLDGGTGDVNQTSGLTAAGTVGVTGNNIDLDLDGTSSVDAVGQGNVTLENQNAPTVNVIAASLGTGNVAYSGGDAITVERLFAANGNVSVISPGSSITATADPSMVDVGGTMPAGNTIAAPNGTITLQGTTINANVTTNDVTATGTGNIDIDTTGSPNVNANLDSSGGAVSLTGDSSVTGSFDGTTASITGSTIDVSTGMDVTEVTTNASTGNVTVVGNSANLSVINNSPNGTASFTNNGGNLNTNGGFTADNIVLIATGNLVTGVLDAGTGSITLGAADIEADVTAGTVIANASSGDVDITGLSSPSMTVEGSATGEFRAVNDGNIATNQVTAGSIFIETQGAGNNLTNNSGNLNASTVTLNSDGTVQATTQGVTTLTSAGGLGVDITNSGSNITNGSITAQDTLGAPAVDADVTLRNSGSIGNGYSIGATGNVTVESTGGGAIDVSVTDLNTSSPSSLTASGGSVNANVTDIASVSATSTSGDISVQASSNPAQDLSFTGTSANDLNVTNNSGGVAVSGTSATGDVSITGTGAVTTNPQAADPIGGASVTLSGSSVDVDVDTASVTATATGGDVTIGSTRATSMQVTGSATGDFTASNTGGIAHNNVSATNVSLDGQSGLLERNSGTLTATDQVTVAGTSVTAQTDAARINAQAPTGDVTITNLSDNVTDAVVVAGTTASFTTPGTANISQFDGQNLTLDVGQSVTGNFSGGTVNLAGTDLNVTVNADQISATAREGDAVIQSSGSGLLTVTDSSASGNFDLTAQGAVTVNNGSAGGDYQLSAQGDVEFDTITANNVTISTPGDITDTSNTIIASGITLNGNNVFVNTQGQVIVVTAQGAVTVANTLVDVSSLSIDAQGNVSFGTDGNLNIASVSGGQLVELTAGGNISADSGAFVSATDVALTVGGTITPDLDNPLNVQASGTITVTAPGSPGFSGQGVVLPEEIAAALEGSIPESSVIIGSGSGFIFYNGVLLNGPPVVSTPTPVIVPPPEVQDTIGQQSGEVIDDGSVGSAANDGLVTESPTQKLVAQLTEGAEGGGGEGMETSALMTLDINDLGEVSVAITEPSPQDTAIDSSEEMTADDVLDLETGELVEVKVAVYYDSTNDQLIMAVDLRADDIIDLDIEEYGLIPLNLEYTFLADPNLIVEKLRADDLIDLEVEDLGRIPIVVHVEGNS